MGLGALLAVGTVAGSLRATEPPASSPRPQAAPAPSRPPSATPRPSARPRNLPPPPPPMPPATEGPDPARDTGWLPHRDPRPFSRPAIGEALQEALPVWQRCGESMAFGAPGGRLVVKFTVAPGDDGMAEIRDATVTGDMDAPLLKSCVRGVVEEFRVASPDGPQTVIKTLTFRPPTEPP